MDNNLSITGPFLIVLGLIEKIPPTLQLILILVGIFVSTVSAVINVLNYRDRKRKERDEKQKV